MVNEPGVNGLLSLSDDSPTRVLVTDDQAGGVLGALLPDARAGATSVFAAVDDGGVVRATSGSGTFGSQATVTFVSTDPSRRRRGVGHAMIGAPLRCARNAGASRACLDASGAPSRPT